MMRRAFLPAIMMLLLLSPALSAQSLLHAWSSRFGDANIQNSQCVATDGAGNVVLAGRFWGTIDFGGGPLSGAGSGDVFLAKFDANGNHLWSKRFGDGFIDCPRGVAVDGLGNVVLTGYYSVNIDFGGGWIGPTPDGYTNVFLAKFDADGNHIWSKSFGGPESQEGWAIAVDASANVLVTGGFKGTMDFGGGVLTSAGDWDVFVAKLDPNGNHIWSSQFGDGGSQGGYSIAADDSTNVIVTGYFTGSADFGGGTLSSAGSFDVYVAKFDPNGNHRWSKRFGDASDQRCPAVAVDHSGNVVLVGFLMGTIDFGGGVLTSAGGWDMFAAKYDPSGAHIWSRKYGDASDQYLNCGAVDSDGTVFAAGYYAGTVDFGGGALTSAGGNDVCLLHLDAAGNHVTSKRFGDGGDQYAAGIATDQARGIILTGSFYSGVDFGGGTLASAGNTDVYLAQFLNLPPEPAIFSVLDVGNDQGKCVRINFCRSSRDEAGSSTPILQYEAFRRIDPLPAMHSTAPAVLEAGALDTRMRRSREAGMISEVTVLLNGWDYVGAAPAHGELMYNILAPTLADSTVESGMNWSVFFIRAATANPLTFFDSEPDSGYSVDNLAPSPPEHLVFAEPGVLSWDEASEPDFEYFTVYGSSSPTFDSGAALLGYTIETSYGVEGQWYDYYHVTSTDFAGNEGNASTVSNTMTGVDETPPATLDIGAYPNPFNPATTLTYSVPVAGPVTLAVYSADGGLIETLLDDALRAPGIYRVAYRATQASGVYFVRLTTASGVAIRKIVVLK